LPRQPGLAARPAVRGLIASLVRPALIPAPSEPKPGASRLHRLTGLDLVVAALAFGLGLVYLNLRLLGGWRLDGLGSALSLAVCQVFWWQAIIAELYVLAAALAAGILDQSRVSFRFCILDLPAPIAVVSALGAVFLLEEGPRQGAPAPERLFG
jgi:hypothetical protein